MAYYFCNFITHWIYGVLGTPSNLVNFLKSQAIDVYSLATCSIIWDLLGMKYIWTHGALLNDVDTDQKRIFQTFKSMQIPFPAFLYLSNHQCPSKMKRTPNFYTADVIRQPLCKCHIKIHQVQSIETVSLNIYPNSWFSKSNVQTSCDQTIK